MKKKEAPNFRTVCRTGEIPEGDGRMFAIAERTIGLFNVGGCFFALANECPHAGASLAHGIVENGTVRCRIHHWRFSIRDGTYLDEDKAHCNVQSFPVRVVGDEVQIEVVTDDDG